MADKFKDVFVPNIQGANKTSYSQWKSSNPGEAAKWEAFRDAVYTYKKGDPALTAPALATKYGKALVAAGELQVSVTDLGAVWPTQPPPPTGGLVANVWVDTTGGSATRQSTAGDYVDAQACSSLAQAHSVAQAGDVIGVKAGSYATQTLTLTKSVLIVCETGVAFGTVNFNPGCGSIQLKSLDDSTLNTMATFDFIGIGVASTGNPATDIVIRGLNGGTITVNNGLRTRIYACDLGPGENRRNETAPYLPKTPVDTLWDGNWIHGFYTNPPGSTTFHAEGILNVAGNGLMIRNNILGRDKAGNIDSNKSTGDLSFFYRNDPNFANIIVRDNQAYSLPWQVPGDASYNVQYDGKIYNLQFINNSFPKGIINTGPGANPAVAPPPNWPPA